MKLPVRHKITIPLSIDLLSNVNQQIYSRISILTTVALVMGKCILKNSSAPVSESEFLKTGGLPPISAPWDPRPVFVFNWTLNGYSPYATSSLTRGWVSSLQLLLVLVSAVILWPSPAGLMTIIFCLRFETLPTWTARSTHGGPIYPQTLGSLLVASYGSQSYDRGNRSLSYILLVSLSLRSGCLDVHKRDFQQAWDRVYWKGDKTKNSVSYMLHWAWPMSSWANIWLTQSIQKLILINRTFCRASENHCLVEAPRVKARIQ
jgi:hypothetical protein